MHFYKSTRLISRVIFFCCFILSSANVWSQQFTSIKSNEGIEIRENGKKVLFYQVRPKSIEGKYERAGFVHPLYSLNEKVVTDDMPPDHPYHRGIFWAWHQVIIDDKNIADGWTSEHISWQPQKVAVKKHKKSISLKSQMLWNAILDNTPTAIIKEETRITVFRATSQYRILDFDIHLFPLVKNLKIGGSDDAKGYGGFCLRLKLPKDLAFTSGDKKVIPQETPVLAGPWMDFTGSLEGESSPKSGVVVFGYPHDNGRQYPWILRSVTSMQNVPYPGRTPVELHKKGLRLKYRIVVHKDGMSTEDIEKLYQQYRKS